MMVVINMEKLLKEKKKKLFGSNDFLNYLLHWTKPWKDFMVNQDINKYNFLIFLKT